MSKDTVKCDINVTGYCETHKCESYKCYPTNDPISEIVELIRRGDAFSRGSKAPVHENHLTREGAHQAISNLLIEARIDEQNKTSYFKYDDGDVEITYNGGDIDSQRQEARISELQQQLKDKETK